MVSVYIRGLALGAVLLLASMAAIWMLDQQRVSVLSGEMQRMTWELDDSRLFLGYLDSMAPEEKCGVMESRVLQQVQKADELAKRIDSYRNANVFNEDYYTLKKTFIYKDFELFLQFRSLREECGKDLNYIIYFYSENDPDRSICPDCAVEESIVSGIRNSCPNTWVFALPYNTDIGIVQAVRDRYNITRVPSVVVNGEQVFQGLTDAEAMMPGISCGANPLA